jgi:hypothetical protein
MFSGGDYEEVTRWLANFATAHAKRENVRAEVEIDTAGPREGTSYGIHARIGAAVAPAPGEPPVELSFAEVATGRGSLAWCDALAARVRALVRGLASGEPERRSA